MTGLRYASISIVVTLATASACPAVDSDDGLEDETGDGDGDAPGDGDGAPGDGDGDGDDELDVFSALCEFNCGHFFNCAPAEFGQWYADPIECRVACIVRYGGCIAEATNYLNCFTDLACADVVLAVTEGPAVTACGPVYAAAEAACGR